MSEISIQRTIDGSQTLFSNRFNETYHSCHGALAETNHVFIKEGLLKIATKESIVRVGEIGLGSGLNAWATLVSTLKFGFTIDYTSIEGYPPDYEVLSQFSPSDSEEEISWYKAIIETKSGIQSCPHPQFQFLWILGLWPEINPFSSLDVLFYDAFSPNTQPELWNENALNAAFSSLKRGGILVTYCAKGEVKRTLKKLGFEVENPPGPKGKREMTRAIKI